MKSHYRVVVIGGGVVGASVLYHLARFGWTDVALVERAELTAGSTWHAAAGCHAINADPNIAALQSYTIKLYREIEAESGQSVGMHMTGGLNLAGSAERWEWTKHEWALFKTLDIEARLVGPAEIRELCPIVDVTSLHGGLYDPNEGHLDPHGVTHAYAGAARMRGAEVILHNRVVELRPRRGGWDLVTEKGTITADHVVNAAGLWARRVGRMAGVDLPVTPMEHHYLITDDIPEIAALKQELPAITDLEGFTYLRQERKGVLLGVYERNPKHWHVDGAPWDYGMDLIPEDIGRIEEELAIGFARFPAIARAGIRRCVNGAFTFTPDGNPIVGPVPGLPGYWVACGCMAGFSQGGAIGLALARWMIDGDPGADVYGMDVARYGPFATNDAYLRQTTAQFYARRFVLTYPNEQLPAGRPLKVTPAHDAMKAAGAVFGAVWGTEAPLFFAPPGFRETPSLRRSNAHDLVGAEVRAAREAAALMETAVYARYEVSGPGAEAWLDRMLAARLPAQGRIRLAPMLNPAGRLMGDLTVTRLDTERFLLVGSYHVQAWHMRWFEDHRPASGVTLRNLSDDRIGFALNGPNARAVLARLTVSDVSVAAFPFLTARTLDVGLAPALVARLAYTGETGFEITVPAAYHRTLRAALREAGRDLGLREIGLRALDSLRLEKSFGGWQTEFTQGYTPGMSGLDRFVAYDKPDFIGRDAALRERDLGPTQRLVTLDIDATNADAMGYEPVSHGARRVGYVTSGAYGHWVGKSLAFAYVDAAAARDRPDLTVHVVGEARAARILDAPAYDPSGLRMRM